MSEELKLDHLNSEVRKDIIELRTKINAFQSGKMDEERFKHFRLTRGVYGQRQFGVQMFRTKIPFGKLTTAQLIRLADVSEKFTNGNLHITTRQNIQMHHVKVGDSPAIWKELGEVGVTAREACGNTVRNLTASANAGIDPDELFDVSPYVQASYEYFLRNPICQDMGRKIKPAFSSSDKDSAYTYFHDFGFIPRVKTENGEEIRGFKVVVGGGLGAQSIIAQTAYEFLHEDHIIPFMEAAIRVFDRHGEREKRFKARMKFLVKKLGLEGFMELVEEERKALKNKIYKIDRNSVAIPEPAPEKTPPTQQPNNIDKYNLWLSTNVYEQKQKGFYAVQVKVHLGDIQAETARQFAAVVKEYAADDMRLTVNQGVLLKFIRKEALPHIFNELEKLGLGEAGFDTIADITACPGTDTCNLGVTNSTGLSTILEKVIYEEYPHLVDETNIKIKISGCMNACGQHMAANIGLHGSSIKKKEMVIPAMQIVLGGGVDENGVGFIADKVIKIPSKKMPDALRLLLDDYENNANENEYFNNYYQRQGKKYFYTLIKPLADITALSETDLFDWGQNQQYVQEIGVGECAGVALDMVGAIIGDAKEKILLGQEALEAGAWADGIYHAYSGFVIGAKALLLSQDKKCNTQIGIIKDFDTHFVEAGIFTFENTFQETALQINKNEPSEDFAKKYLAQSSDFVSKVITEREKQLGEDGKDKLVIDKYYKA